MNVYISISFGCGSVCPKLLFVFVFAHNRLLALQDRDLRQEEIEGTFI